MKLVTLKELLGNAKGKYAVPAINCFNLEMIQAVLDAAEEMRSPIIIQAAPRDLAYSSGETIVSLTKAVGQNRDILAAIHLDHGHSYEVAVQCVRAGFTSIMIDGSSFSFEENIALTRKVAELAHCAGISCEAELGTIGDRTETGEKIANAYMTDPDKAQEFVCSTGIDCLAVGVGNAHGLYPLPPDLDLDRLREIEMRVPVPLVLHGGTGIPEEQIKQGIKRGIAKVNFSTVVRRNMAEKIYTLCKQNTGNLNIEHMFCEGQNGFKEAVMEVIRLCGSRDKCSL